MPVQIGLVDLADRPADANINVTVYGLRIRSASMPSESAARSKTTKSAMLE